MTNDLMKELADRVAKYCADNPSPATKNEVYIRKCVRRWMLVDMINDTRTKLAGEVSISAPLNPVFVQRWVVDLTLLNSELLLSSLETQK